MVVEGGVDDEVLINGTVYEAGQHGFNWDDVPEADCGAVTGDNGAHPYNYTVVLAPNASVTVGAKDNGLGGSIDGAWFLETCYDEPP